MFNQIAYEQKPYHLHARLFLPFAGFFFKVTLSLKDIFTIQVAV